MHKICNRCSAANRKGLVKTGAFCPGPFTEKFVLDQFWMQKLSQQKLVWPGHFWLPKSVQPDQNWFGHGLLNISAFDVVI